MVGAYFKWFGIETVNFCLSACVGQFECDFPSSSFKNLYRTTLTSSKINMKLKGAKYDRRRGPNAPPELFSLEKSGQKNKNLFSGRMRQSSLFVFSSTFPVVMEVLLVSSDHFTFSCSNKMVPFFGGWQIKFLWNV